MLCIVEYESDSVLTVIHYDSIKYVKSNVSVTDCSSDWLKLTVVDRKFAQSPAKVLWPGVIQTPLAASVQMVL